MSVQGVDHIQLPIPIGGQRLDLSEGRYTGVAPQAHIALRVQQLPRLTKSHHAAGLRIDAAPLPSGEARIYFEDPFGNRIELIEPTSGFIQSSGDQRASDLQYAV